MERKGNCRGQDGALKKDSEVRPEYGENRAFDRLVRARDSETTSSRENKRHPLLTVRRINSQS